MRRLALLSVLVLVPAPAHAQGCWQEAMGYACSSHRHAQHTPRRRATPQHYYEQERRHYRSPEEGEACRRVVDVLSTEHTQEDHARDAARKLWMAKVQWTWGGQYMDIDQAADARWHCGPSNAHDTFSAKLSETVGKLVGRDGQNVRCAFWARPCRAPREDEKGSRRR